MKITKVTDPAARRADENQAAAQARLAATVDYVAMMADVVLPEQDEKDMEGAPDEQVR